MGVMMQPGFRYTKAQVKSMMTDEHAKALQYQGYFLQFDGTYYTLVKHTEAFASGRVGGTVLDRKKQGALEGELFAPDGSRFIGQASFEEPGTPAKRTPTERLESLVQKLWPEVKDMGHLPGVKDEDILPIVANMQQRSLHVERMTGETLRQIAAAFLTQSEKEHEEKLSHQITRHED
jgi:hypothetical protein